MRQSRRKPGFCGSIKTSSCGNICFTGTSGPVCHGCCASSSPGTKELMANAKSVWTITTPVFGSVGSQRQRRCHLVTLVLPAMTQKRDTSPPSLPGHQVQGRGEGLVLGMLLMPPALAGALPSGTFHVLLPFSHHLVTNLAPRK